jgi:hypothetical protein
MTEKTFYLMQQTQVRVQIFLWGLLVQCLQTTVNITVNIGVSSGQSSDISPDFPGPVPANHG